MRPSYPAVMRTVLAADKQLGESKFGAVLTLLSLAVLISNTALAAAPSHFLLHPIKLLPRNKSLMVVFDQIHRQGAVILTDFL